ncbi:glycosyltransferase family 39 protein [Candidatus Sumerlaeota bacterium]|nr:glycosyltransferase family 39 protein [Candidatus Sumerlaeota bacterium]
MNPDEQHTDAADDKASLWHWLIFAALMILAALMRWRNHAHMSIWYDEGFSFVLINKPWAEMMHIIRTDDHPPLYYYFLRGWMALFPGSPADGVDYAAWGRKLSMLFGWIALIPGYVYARSLFGRRTALAFLALMAANPYLIHYSHEARMYTLLLNFAILSHWAVWQLREKWRWGWAALWCVSGMLMLYTHYYALALVMGQFFCLATWLRRQIKSWGKTLSTLAILGFAVFLLYWHWLYWFFVQLMNNTAGGVHSHHGQVTRHMLVFYLDPFLGRIPNLPLDPLVQWLREIHLLSQPHGPELLSPLQKILFAVALCLMLIGCTVYLQRKERLLWIYIAWTLVFPLLFTFFIYQIELEGRLYGRLLIIHWAPFFVLVASGASGNSDGEKAWHNKSRATLYIIVLFTFIASWSMYSVKDERGVQLFLYQQAIAQTPRDLPVYHSSQHSLFPIMTYERMNPRHKFLLRGEQSLIVCMLAGNDCLIKPSKAQKKIQLPCLLVVYNEIYLLNQREREEKKNAIVLDCLSKFFPENSIATPLFDFGMRKWGRVLYVQPPPSPADD